MNYEYVEGIEKPKRVSIYDLKVGDCFKSATKKGKPSGTVFIKTQNGATLIGCNDLSTLSPGEFIGIVWNSFEIFNIGTWSEGIVKLETKLLVSEKETK